MKRYPTDPNDFIEYTNFKIVVPTEEDRQEIMEAFNHIHFSDIDTDFITVNQLAHEYLPMHFDKNKPNSEGNPKYFNIIVDSDLYKKLEDKQC